MYKRITLVLALALPILGQNIQLHYEASEDRQYPVTTLEMFKPDDYGSTFWFVDMEYDKSALSLAYWEIARYFSLPVNNLSATVQYNDGVATFGNLGKVWLLGLNYYLQIGNVGLPIDILYRSAQGADSPDFQFTTSWLMPFLGDRLEFAGFLDIWSQDAGSDSKDIVILTEPQLWYRIGKSFAVGSEVEISHNFIFNETALQFRPTLGVRWEF